MKIYIIILILISYGTLELTRMVIYIIISFPDGAITSLDYPKWAFVTELILMWVAYLLGIGMIARRIKE